MSLSNYLLNSVSLQTYTKEHNRKQLYQALLDMVVLFEDRCYIFEFKVIEQLKDENS
jgi:hypothetical protein